MDKKENTTQERPVMKPSYKRGFTPTDEFVETRKALIENQKMIADRIYIPRAFQGIISCIVTDEGIEFILVDSKKQQTNRGVE